MKLDIIQVPNSLQRHYKAVPYLKPHRIRVLITYYWCTEENNYLCVIKQPQNIVDRIQYASAKELGGILEEYNRKAYQDNDWNPISVKASYSSILSTIDANLNQCKMYADFGHAVINVHDYKTGEDSILHVQQALTNLQLAKEFFANPPSVTNPNTEGITVDASKIDWDKPVFTANEIKTLLGVSDSTFNRWINGGWISYTQMEGSDKKFIKKEDLYAFLNNKKIFYPSSK